MTFLYAFLFCGILSLIAQIILDNTKLTPGHVNTLFVIFGSFLSFLGIYKKIELLAFSAAALPITNFGNLLFEGACVGFKTNGIIGMFENIFLYSSFGISITILLAFTISLFTKPKN